MEKILKLYTYVDGGVNDTPFPNVEDPIEIGAFRYDATRMGGAPTITASVNYPTCLDGEWTKNVYAEFNGEKYYLKQTPTSSYDNEDVLYKHDLELVSERVILDNVYFFDAVVGEPQGDDKPVSNSTKIVFFGDIHEFASRLGHSLAYSGIDYTVTVDEGVESEEKLMSFEDQFFSNVLQEIYNVYEIPYYFDGKVIHIGFSKDEPTTTFSYGVDDALISITKTNANYKVVNRVTGTGSTENIPFYYPNNSPKGTIATTENDGSQLGARIVDCELYANEVELDGVLTYKALEASITKVTDTLGRQIISGSPSLYTLFTYKGGTTRFKAYATSYESGDVQLTLSPVLNIKRYANDEDTVGVDAVCTTTFRVYANGVLLAKEKVVGESCTLNFALEEGDTVLDIYMNYTPEYTSSLNKFEGNIGLSWSIDTNEGWYYNDKEVILKDVGLAISNSNPRTGDTITQTLVKYVKTSQNLMPSIYRETDGDERFYNAIDDTYADESGDLIEFKNPYVEGKPVEHIITVEDIKPTIKEVVVNGVRIDKFADIAFDEGDNNETYEDEDGNVNFEHPYFFVKLHKMDFNLFEHAIEQNPMRIAMTSGACGSCEFEVSVDDETMKNTVQVDDDGNLIYDENGRVLCGVEDFQQEIHDFQERQQDTINYEVWIALKKEESTYGILMPYAPDGNNSVGHLPTTDDTFVILGINLPESYILNAEKKLEDEIIKYLKDNNEEKFTFSIGFSRVYFEENNSALDTLSENSKIRIMYDGNSFDLYVTSFSYTMSEGDILPEIKVELDDTLKTTQNALQNAISAVKSELGKALGNIDVVGISAPYFIRKDTNDTALGTINFTKGIKFGEGGKVEVFDNDSAKLTIEYLEVTKKATFTSLEIQEKTHVGGQLLVTPASIICGEVEELDDVYRCYFQTMGEDGDEIFNEFVSGDQAICQTFNAWESKYYWRLVVGIGEDYIDLSKTDCDEGSGIPSAGDKIIQLGNRADTNRQNAIVIASYGDGSPYIIQYKGINSFEITDEKIVTKLSSAENIFTGKVHMEMGSDGLESLEGWTDINTTIGTLEQAISDAEAELENVYDKATVDGKIDDSEQAAIDAAQEKVNVAKEELEQYTDDAIEGMEIGGANLLRNSGFTGDYLSEQLADEAVLEAATELYSAPFDHWTTSGDVSRVDVADVAQSGYGVAFGESEGTISQDVVYKIINGESYTVSFKGMGTEVSCTFGGVTESVALTDSWERYTVTITARSNASAFSLTSISSTLCDIQLEAGTKSTSWSPSQLDNSSDRAYYQSMKYLQSALEGVTEIGGGLVLTEVIRVGDYDKDSDTWVSETGGINGIVTDTSDDVAFWAGGTLTQATETMMKYVDDPTYEATEDEIAAMAKFVVTHGGRAILNDMILRGQVYATGGKIGNMSIGERGLEINDEILDGEVMLDDYGLRGQGSIVAFQIGNCGNETATFSYGEGSVLNCSTTRAALRLEGYDGALALNLAKGMVAGLRPNIVVPTASRLVLTGKEHTVIASSSVAITLEASPQNGQTYEIVRPNANATVTVTAGGSKTILLMYDGAGDRTGFSLSDLGGNRQVARLVFSTDLDKWICWHQNF